MTLRSLRSWDVSLSARTRRVLLSPVALRGPLGTVNSLMVDAGGMGR
jgi:hypothetical protein